MDKLFNKLNRKDKIKFTIFVFSVFSILIIGIGLSFSTINTSMSNTTTDELYQFVGE